MPSSQLRQSFNSSNSDGSGGNTVDGGPNVGNIFEGRGHDFLDPDDINNTIDDFGNTVNPVTTPTSLLPQIASVDPLGQNPDPIDILNATIGGIRNVKSPSFGLNIVPDGNSNPIDWWNPQALNILLGTNAATGSIFNLSNGLTGQVIPPNTFPPVSFPQSGFPSVNNTNGFLNRLIPVIVLGPFFAPPTIPPSTTLPTTAGSATVSSTPDAAPFRRLLFGNQFQVMT